MWVCSECGFKVPADLIGKELMDEHLAEHKRQQLEARRD